MEIPITDCLLSHMHGLWNLVIFQSPRDTHPNEHTSEQSIRIVLRRSALIKTMEDMTYVKEALLDVPFAASSLLFTHACHSSSSSATTSLSATCATRAGSVTFSNRLILRSTDSLSMSLPFGDLDVSLLVVIPQISPVPENFGETA
jgi:hypothetical protein